MKVCCSCGEEDKYEILFRLPIQVVHEGKVYTRPPFAQSDKYICWTYLKSEAMFAFEG